MGFDDGPRDGDPVTEGPGSWLDIAPTRFASCGLTTGGELWCWGSGEHGVLGNGAEDLLAPMQRIGTATWRSVSTYFGHTCGVQRDGSLWCWGRNERGALGDGVVDDDEIARVPRRVGTDAWTMVQSGFRYSCALRDDATLWCWGANDLGQLGDGTKEDRRQPTPIPGATWRTIALGETSACGIRLDDSLWCWGSDRGGQVGNGDPVADEPAPVNIGGARRWSAVAVGESHTCAIELDGTSWCWGKNHDGRLGNGDTVDSTSPVQTVAPPLASIAVGAEHTCGLAPEGELWCWGASQHGEIPGITTSRLATPTRIAAQPMTRLAIGVSVTCAIDGDAQLYCSGLNGSGQAGQPPGETHVPRRADARSDWKAIYADYLHACGLTTSGSLHCWGDGRAGQLGDGSKLDRQLPVDVPGAYVAAALAGPTTLALRADRTLWSTGYDVIDQRYTAEPAKISTGVAAAAIGEGHTCALRDDGVLTCAGSNGYGQLGDGTRVDTTSATVAGAWRSIAAGQYVTCATQSAGLMDQLFCWGERGMHGALATDDATTPTRVDIARNVAQVEIGDLSACARAEGEIWCWGHNGYGQLGDGSAADSVTPVRVGTRSDWIDVDVGDVHACAIAADHTLWCWGHADQGQGGTPTVFQRRSPAQVGSDTDWVDVACGTHFSCALKSDGTRWCFGSNNAGELGDGRAWVTELSRVAL
ncbi:MAG: RCC1 domain-containing protein [Kofleriaceae bacterium]